MFQSNPQGLAQLFSLPPEAQVAGMNLLNQQQTADQTSLMDQQRLLGFNNQMDPVRVRQAGLNADLDQARLPGVQAESQIAGANARKRLALSDADISSSLQKLKADEAKGHVDEIGSIGDLLLQHSQLAFSNPLGAAARTKAALAKIGHADMWNPAWDTSDPGLLARQLQDYGTDLQDVTAKYRQAMKLQEEKATGAGDRAVAVEQMKGEYRLRQEAMRQDGIRRQMESKERLGRNPKNWEQWGAQMAELARQSTDPVERAWLMEQASKAIETSKQIRAASAEVTVGPKPDLPGLADIPDQQSANPPPPNPFQAQPPAKAASGADLLKKLPQGTKQNPDGTFTLPDGRVIRAKQ